jgi:hypothetical protein
METNHIVRVAKVVVGMGIDIHREGATVRCANWPSSSSSNLTMISFTMGIPERSIFQNELSLGTIKGSRLGKKITAVDVL